LAALFPACKGSLAALKRNKHCWEIAQRIFLSRKSECRSSLEILEDDSIVDEVLSNARRDLDGVGGGGGCHGGRHHAQPKLETALSEQGACTGARLYNGDASAAVAACGMGSGHSRSKCRSESDMLVQK
jgi:hypothetical protein